jgi:hypothetical protein
MFEEIFEAIGKSLRAPKCVFVALSEVLRDAPGSR